MLKNIDVIHLFRSAHGDCDCDGDVCMARNMKHGTLSSQPNDARDWFDGRCCTTHCAQCSLCSVCVQCTVKFPVVYH